MGHMGHVRNLSLSLLLLATGPMTWLACGGGKPPETPADESSSGDDSGAGAAAANSASSDTPAGSSSSAASDDTSSAPAASSAAAAAPPPPPTLGSTDCGKCIDTTCAKPEAACGKNSDCQAVLDAVHGCSGTAGSCIEGATPPTGAKPKKLAAGFGKCAKKAISKACKSQCQ
jgi:hypothetical protein